MRTTTPFTSTLALALALSLAGCSGLFGGSSEPIRTYMFEPRTFQTPRATDSSLVLLVSPIQSVGLDSRQMAYAMQPFERNYYAFSQWADTPGRMIMPLLTLEMESTGLFNSVISSASTVAPDLQLEVDLLVMQHEFHTTPSQSRLVMRAQLTDLRARRVVAVSVFEQAAPAPTEDPYGGALAMNFALEAILLEMGGFVRDYVESLDAVGVGPSSAPPATPDLEEGGRPDETRLAQPEGTDPPRVGDPRDAPPTSPWAVAASAFDAKASLQEDEIYGWSASSPAAQLADDRTRVPPGMGAVFVPYLSDPADEPEFTVRRGRASVASGSPGTRVILEPGDYRLELGSGHERMVVNVTVVANETALVPVTWGGLRVEVVDANSLPHRAGYELIAVADRHLFGVGYGADLLVGERILTWILPPNLYRVVQPGASYRARSNYSTVYVPEGGLVRYRLVIDPDTGEFLGAGVVTPEESSEGSGDDRFMPNLVLGANASLTVAGDLIATAEVFIDGLFAYRDEPHEFLSMLQFEGGFTWIDPEIGDALPIQKSADRLRVDFLYSYFLTTFLGPYVRAGVEANLFPAIVVTSEDVAVTRNRLDGSSERVLVSAGGSFQVADFFGQTRFFEGAGVNARLLRSELGQINLSLGLGLRQYVTRGLFGEDPTSAAPELVYNQVDNFTQEGVESFLTGRLRLTSFARFTTSFEIFADFTAFDDPTFLWRSTLSLRLLEFLSLDYTFGLGRQPALSPDTDITHALLLRFAWQIL
jgi:cholesterol transport system auxiliary component